MTFQCAAPMPHAMHLHASSAPGRRPVLVSNQVRSLQGAMGLQRHAPQQLQACPKVATHFISRSARKPARQQRLAQTRAYSSKPDIADRVVGALPYLVPLCDGLRYGKFFFAQYPQASALLAPLNPIISLYFTVPFASIAVFFAVYLGIINNQNFSRYTRFNALQAVLLDIILILPGLFENVIRPPGGGPGLQIYISLYNSIWLFVFISVAYGVGSCLLGQTPRLPLVADAAEQQLR